jgi:baseplate upper protein BppU
MSDFHIKQGDRLPVVDAFLKRADGTAVNLAGTTVRFLMRYRGTGTAAIVAAAAIVDAPTGRVQYAWAAADTATPGDYEAEFEVAFADGRQQTFPADGYIAVRIMRQVA